MELENMDCMDIEDLEKYRKILLLAEEYARWKMKAIKYRLEGTIQRALLCEGACDKLYKQLPQESRW